MSTELSYKNVGVDISRTDQIKREMGDLIKSDDKRVMNHIGAFASLYDFSKFNLEKAAYYTLNALTQFYTDPRIEMLMKDIEVDDTSYIYDIKIDGKNRTEKRTQSFFESAIDLRQ